MLEKSKFKQSFYLSSKWAVKLRRQFAISTTHLAQELLMNVQCSSGSRSFAKETKRALKMRRTVADRGRPSEVDNDQLRAIIEADPLRSTWEVGKELNIDHSEVMQHLKQIGRVKKLDKWVPHELTANSKKLFWSFVFSYSIEQQWTISWLDCDMQWKSGFYITTCDDQLRLDQEEAKLAPKKRVMGHCLVVCCWSDPLQFSESWQNHYTWEVCLANWCDALKTATSAMVNRMDPILLSHNAQLHITISASEVEWTGLWSFALSAIFTWPVANQLLLLQASWQLFAGKMLPQPAGSTQYFPRVCQIPKHGFLCYRYKQTFLIGKKCVDCNGPYFN